MLPRPTVVVAPISACHSTASTKVLVDRVEIVNILKDIEGIKRRLQRELKQTE